MSPTNLEQSAPTIYSQHSPLAQYRHTQNTQNNQNKLLLAPSAHPSALCYATGPPDMLQMVATQNHHHQRLQTMASHFSASASASAHHHHHQQQQQHASPLMDRFFQVTTPSHQHVDSHAIGSCCSEGGGNLGLGEGGQKGPAARAAAHNAATTTCDNDDDNDDKRKGATRALGGPPDTDARSRRLIDRPGRVENCVRLARARLVSHSAKDRGPRAWVGVFPLWAAMGAERDFARRRRRRRSLSPESSRSLPPPSAGR